jgi:site-specific DNA-adenine methylase
MLKNNLRVMKKKNVKTYNGDCQEYMNILEQDIVYFDPPWGGTDYKNAPMGTLRLQLTDRDDEKMDLEDIIIHMRDKASVCVVKLPVNYDVNYLEEKI